MRIVMVYQHFMVSGVGSTKPYDLARYLVSRGHEVTVICGRGYLSQGMEVPPGVVRRMAVGPVRVICLGVDYRQKMGFLRRLWAFMSFTMLAMWMVCRLPAFDVLLASSTPLTVGLVGLVAHHVRKRPWVFELRDLWPDFPVRAGYLKNRLLIAIASFFERWFYRDATTITAISQRMCDYLIERGIEAQKLVFIPTGVDLAAAAQAAPDHDWWRRHGIEGCLRAVYLGAHGFANGLDYVLNAACYLKPEDRIKMVLIGDGVEKPRLVQQARDRGLDCVIFLPPVRRELVPGILQAADVALMIDLVTPGAETSLPNKFFDYLAAGLPMITNNPAELWDHLQQARAGVLVDDRRPAQLIEALRELRDDHDKARELGRRARELAALRFDRELLHQHWEQVLVAAAGTNPLAKTSKPGRM
jgi:glycosyltransferase involved in cell wall biosynthesis